MVPAGVCDDVMNFPDSRFEIDQLAAQFAATPYSWAAITNPWSI
jgi:hypothetical protein